MIAFVALSVSSDDEELASVEDEELVEEIELDELIEGLSVIYFCELEVFVSFAF